MADTTTVFQSGNSQAVRLPKEFRFKSKTVEIFRRGDEVVLREKPRTMGEVLAENGFDLLGPPSARELQDHEKMMAAIRAPQPPDRRAWDALWDGHAVPHDAPQSGSKAPARKPRQR
jgi:virulence-associated protein VagC